VPHTFQESQRAAFNIGAVVAAHDWLDGLGRLVGVVEGDGADIVVKNVSLNNAMEESAADEAELAVNSCGGSTNVSPATSCIMRKCWIGVLKVCNCNYK
jgi:hypothetical protein